MTFLWAFLVTSLVFSIVMMFKADNTRKNHRKIFDAIDDYGEKTNDHFNCIRLIDSMESCDRTLFRFWDWGYTRILPKEDFELIKPYIKEKHYACNSRR